VFYPYIKNRTLFVVLFTSFTILLVEIGLWYFFDDQPSPAAILIEIPFVAAGWWLYHDVVTKRLETTKK